MSEENKSEGKNETDTNTSPDDAVSAAGQSGQSGVDDHAAIKAGAGKGDNKVPQSPPPDADSQPIGKWEDVDLGLPDDAAISPELLADFGKQAVSLGLSVKQAKALARWNYETGEAMRKQLLETGVEQLKKAWGANYEARRNAALTLVSQLDRELGGESFSKALNACGAAYQAPIVMALAHLAGRLSEDSMGKNQPDSAGKTETALEGLTNALKEARGR